MCGVIRKATQLSQYFGLHSNDRLLHQCNCTLVQPTLLRGCLYLSHQCVCYLASLNPLVYGSVRCSLSARCFVESDAIIMRVCVCVCLCALQALPRISGFLNRRRKWPLPSWSRAWFVFENNAILQFAKSDQDASAEAASDKIDLRTATSVEAYSSFSNKPFCFEVSFYGSTNTLILQADNQVQYEEWMQVIQQVIDTRRYRKRFGKVCA